MGIRLRYTSAILLTLGLGLLPVRGYSAPPGPVTERQFAELLAFKVGEIAELQPLWARAKQNGIRLYLAGGGVRGLAHYLWVRLSQRSLAEVRADKLPEFDKLFLSKSTDIDLVIETPLSEQRYRAALGPFGGWDLTPRVKFDELTSIGGPHVEKMLLAPGAVVDPEGAVKDFVAGELGVTFVPKRKFYGSPIVHAEAITRMSQALRFARMHQEMPDLRVSPDQWRAVTAIILEDDLSGTLMPTEIRRDHRLFRELKKIFGNADQDFVRAAELLRESGTLPILAKSGFYFPFDPTKYDAQAMDRRLAKLGWGEPDRAHARKMIRNRAALSTAWIRSLACRYLMTRDAPWNPVRETK